MLGSYLEKAWNWARLIFSRIKANLNLTDIQKNLDLLSKIFSSIFQITLLIVIGYFLVMLANFIHDAQEGITILPFDTTGMGGDCSGKAVADRLGMEMQKIRGIHEYKEMTINSMKNTTSKSIPGTPLQSAPSIPAIFSEGKSLDKSLSALGNVDVGPASISFGQMLLILRSITGSSDRSITGSLEIYGSNISIVALMEDKGSDRGTAVWEMTLPIGNNNLSIEENVPGLIKDLAYNIFNDIRQDYRANATQSSWISFKYLTEGWIAYRNYNLTGNLSHLERAEGMMRRALREDPKGNESAQFMALMQSVWFAKGVAFSERGGWSDAIGAFEKAIEIDPNNKLYWVSKSYALNKLSGTRDVKIDVDKKALEAAEKAIALDPEYADAWHEKGISLYNLREYNKSLEAYEKSIDLDSSKWWYYHDYALALWIKGKEDGCNECYAKAIETLDIAFEMDLDPTTKDYIEDLMGTIMRDFKSSGPSVVEEP